MNVIAVLHSVSRRWARSRYTVCLAPFVSALAIRQARAGRIQIEDPAKEQGENHAAA
jgi:hypothetical protein